MEKKRLIKLYALVFILAAVFLPGFAKYQEMRGRNSALKAKIAELKKENALLYEEMKSLKSDVVYVEKTAREKMGVVRKGEIVYRVVPDESKRGQTPF